MFAEHKKTLIALLAGIGILIVAAFLLSFVPGVGQIPVDPAPAISSGNTDSTVSDIPQTSFDGFVLKKSENSLYVGANPGQLIQEGLVRNVLITPQTRFRKSFIQTDENDSFESERSVNASISDVVEGSRVVVSAKNSVDVSIETVFEAESIVIIEEN